MEYQIFDVLETRIAEFKVLRRTDRPKVPQKDR